MKRKLLGQVGVDSGLSIQEVLTMITKTIHANNLV